MPTATKPRFYWTALAALVAALCLVLAPSAVGAKQRRSHAVLLEFQRLQPCPSTGLTTGRCPGYWKDHVVPLACGGADAVVNLQWQTIAAARAKDKWERRGC